MAKRLIRIAATETMHYVNEVTLNVPDEIAADESRLLAWVDEHQDAWWLTVTDGRTNATGFHAVEAVLVTDTQDTSPAENRST
ncbi:hypothetical protein ACQEVF_57720 [Nonomuraea polychroma]|uniref:hypothetical protein n=1 Tax=Nonomuraea polychroma TaxID=46176 RepID=UPI003D8D3D89